MLDDAFRITIDKLFQTKYSEGILENSIYTSPFHVDNYKDDESMFEFLCNADIDEDDYCKNIKNMNF